VRPGSDLDVEDGEWFAKEVGGPEPDGADEEARRLVRSMSGRVNVGLMGDEYGGVEKEAESKVGVRKAGCFCGVLCCIVGRSETRKRSGDKTLRSGRKRTRDRFLDEGTKAKRLYIGSSRTPRFDDMINVLGHLRKGIHVGCQLLAEGGGRRERRDVGFVRATSYRCLRLRLIRL